MKKSIILSRTILAASIATLVGSYATHASTR